MLFTMAKNFFDTPSLPRPIISLFFIILSVLIFIILLGITYYYGFVFSIENEFLKSNLLFAVPSLIWFFYYGVQSLYSIFSDSLSLDYIVASIIIISSWFFLLRLTTLTNNNSYAKQQVKFLKKQLSEANRGNDFFDDTTNPIDFLIQLVVGIVVVVIYLFFWIFDVLLQLCIIFLQFMFLLLILNNISSLEINSSLIYTGYELVFNKFDIYIVNYIEQLAYMQSADYYFLIIVLLLLSWVSFRQSGVPSMIRVMMLISSLTILLLSSYQYGSDFGNKTLKFWSVTIEQNNKTVSICDNGCALLMQKSNHVVVLDVEKNELHDLTGLKLNIHFSKKKTLNKFKI